jgi:hypothetical protein
MHEVKDGPRTLQFEGQLLGTSSSWREGSFRWIEFKLYKTQGGQYVLSRVGVSLVFHGAACPLVKRYGLREEDPMDLADNATPCPECRPTFTLPVVFPEKYRHWALTTSEADAVLDALYKEDDNGSRYLTKVAERLLEQASRDDAALDLAYRIEIIL